MVSTAVATCGFTHSESDSEVAVTSVALQVKGSREHQVRKRNKALQVRFKDICEAQQEAELHHTRRRYMTVPARRSAPSATRSTAVQTSPDLRSRYLTFPQERKKSHTVKHHATATEDTPSLHLKRAKATDSNALVLRCDDLDGSAPQRAVGGDEGEVSEPIAWNSLTQVECVESLSERVPRLHRLVPPLKAPPPEPDGDVTERLQAMEKTVSSSQETIRVLLGVIQELEKSEAQRDGLSYRTGQDTTNCDTCRNSACIIYSVELDFKLQEDRLLPLLRRLCPGGASVFTPSAERKKPGRWKLWFL